MKKMLFFVTLIIVISVLAPKSETDTTNNNLENDYDEIILEISNDKSASITFDLELINKTMIINDIKTEKKEISK